MNITEEAKQKRREYYKEWRSRNKDRVKEYNKRYWEKKALEEARGND